LPAKAVTSISSVDLGRWKLVIRAMYPVKAKGVRSQTYSYYKPKIRGDTGPGDCCLGELRKYLMDVRYSKAWM
jgi:hypothetical protein